MKNRVFGTMLPKTRLFAQHVQKAACPAVVWLLPLELHPGVNLAPEKKTKVSPENLTREGGEGACVLAGINPHPEKKAAVCQNILTREGQTTARGWREEVSNR